METELALADWCSAPYGGKGEAFAVYRAAADREDAAAVAWLEACHAFDAAQAVASYRNRRIPPHSPSARVTIVLGLGD